MLQKIKLAPGVNQENTRYTNEGGWFESDKIRFRQGTPEVIGGWLQYSVATFLGICRSIWVWVTLSALKLIGIGTNLKFYILRGGVYYDVTPLRYDAATFTGLTNPFATTDTSKTVTVTCAAHGAHAGDKVTFTGAVAVGGIPALDLNTQHTILTTPLSSTFTIAVADAATSTVAAGGGTVTAVFTYFNQLLPSNPFATTIGSAEVTVTDPTHGAYTDDFVTFSGATAVAGLTIVGEYQITAVSSTNTYKINVSGTANATTTGGGSVVLAQYQINTGPATQRVDYGWGSSAWGQNTWGNDTRATNTLMRLWSQANFGEDLVFGPRNGGIFYWSASGGVGVRAVNLAQVEGASSVPIVQLQLLVSDNSRFIIAFGCNELGTTALDTMLVRWSDQENAVEWSPSITNQAGGMRLSNGSTIYAALQVRQEILIWTDTALYSMQYLGAPLVWGFTLLGSNLSCAGPNAVTVASDVSYWMGSDKFYKYDGRVQTLRCDLRQHVFGNINHSQDFQTFAATNEGFNEVWWFYCSASSTAVDSYVVYNYLEDVWYYGTMGRTAWLDSGLVTGPLAATYSNNVVLHETGVDDDETGTPAPINAYIVSSQFDIDDGHNFSFIWRVLPDITFRGSSTTGAAPNVTLSLLPLKNSGSGYTVPPSVAGSNEGTVTRVGSYSVDQFTGQINTRIRARQMSIKIESNTLGTTWQLGSPRIDIRPDGRKA